MARIAIIGGGAAGLIAAGKAAENENNSVYIFEKNKILGRKLLITGKGRCNLTNNCDLDEFQNNVLCNGKFLYSAFCNLTPQMLMEFFESLGVELKTERGKRVFPLSDRSADIVNALKKYISKPNISVVNKCVKSIECNNGIITGLYINDTFEAFDKVLVCTGGLSYPATGSSGDGYKFLKKAGHTITKLSPSLVPLVLKENFIYELEGLSLKNVRVTLKNNGKTVYHQFGEMLFTHDGVSGPLILSASAHIKEDFSYTLHIDLKPALDEKQLDLRILRDFDEFKNKNIANALHKLVPKSLIPIILRLSNINEETKVNTITKENRLNLVNTLKNMTFNVFKKGSYDEAVITQGGVSVKEINPKTMESKLIKGLYVAGEILDVDAYTGGFNLQIAFCTGYTAGMNL